MLQQQGFATHLIDPRERDSLRAPSADRRTTALTPASQRELAPFLDGEALTGRVLVVGYTDHIAPETYNGPLSQRRADAIASELRKAWPDARFLTEGHGTYPKLVDGTTDTARAANRRAEIFHLEAAQ